MLRKPLLFIIMTFGMLAQASPVPLDALTLGSAGIVPVSIPAGTKQYIPVSQADLDGDGRFDTLALTGERFSVLSGGMLLWQSPPDWHVVQAAVGDLNRDGKQEVTLLLWRPFRPWPVDRWLPYGGRIADFHNSEGLSCHIILIGWMHDGFHELWAGSAMADPMMSFAVVDLDGDNSQELVALESRYTDPLPSPEVPGKLAFAHTLKVWGWNGFGFTVVSSINGTFSEITLIHAENGRTLILVP